MSDLPRANGSRSSTDLSNLISSFKDELLVCCRMIISLPCGQVSASELRSRQRNSTENSSNRRPQYAPSNFNTQRNAERSHFSSRPLPRHMCCLWILQKRRTFGFFLDVRIPNFPKSILPIKLPTYTRPGLIQVGLDLVNTAGTHISVQSKSINPYSIKSLQSSYRTGRQANP